MDSFPVCTQCGFTLGEAQSRGLFGCSHCYASFGEALQADLLWMHAALEISAAEPPAAKPAANPDPESLARWRRNLAEALRVENYGEAARLRLLIEGASGQGTGRQDAGHRDPNLGKAGGGLGLA